MIRLIKKLRGKINHILQQNREIRKVLLQINRTKDSKRVFLFQTPTHSNIGDHAIAIAELDFLKRYLPNTEVIEINQSIMESFISKYKKHIKPLDIIYLHGGGNFGNEYLNEENLRRLTVRSFPSNKIIVFPQTIDYTEDKNGRLELKKTQDIFSEHKDLTITAREEVSYGLMKEYFPLNKVIMTPDIVLSMHKSFELKREYGLGVIRQDQESILSDSLKRTIKNVLNDNYDNVIFTDMHVENFKSVRTPEERNKVVEGKLLEFAKAKLVITDRLHGMVLAAISGTPCIAFSNYNQKVSGTYSWIKDLEYIKFVEDEEELFVAFDELKKLSTYKPYNSTQLNSVFDPLINNLQYD